MIKSRDTLGLIDAGISFRRVCKGMEQFGLSPQDISFILITHEHTDHTAGLRVLLKNVKPRLFVPDLIRPDFSFSFPDHCITGLQSGKEFELDGLRVTGFNNFHDSKACFGYRIDSGNLVLGHATDLGKPAVHTPMYLKEADYLVIESNYDRKMLLTGKYPHFLKRRISGNYGHLDNDIALHLVDRIRHAGLKKVMLAHLSKENNTPEIVSEKFSSRFPDLDFSVADRSCPTRLF